MHHKKNSAWYGFYDTCQMAPLESFNVWIHLQTLIKAEKDPTPPNWRKKTYLKNYVDREMVPKDKNHSWDREYSSIGRGVLQKNPYKKSLQIVGFVG